MIGLLCGANGCDTAGFAERYSTVLSSSSEKTIF